MKLYIAYPEEGMNKRSKAEQSIYQQELETDKNTSLIDAPLTCDRLPADLVGATYIVITPEKRQLLFSLTGQQAATETGQTGWHIWFGELTNPEVAKQYKKVRDFLEKCGKNIAI